MMSIVPLLVSALELGLIYSLVTLGVHLSSRVARFDDFTLEGSFSLGGALTVYFLIKKQIPCVPTMFLAMCAGVLAGMMTATIYRYLRISPLICGLVVTTGLFSFNLYFAESHQSLVHHTTLFSLASSIHPALVLLVFVGLVFTALYWFSLTELGLLLKASGDNKQFVTNLGHSHHLMTLISLAIANGCAALSGSLFVQWAGFFSITGRIGVLVTGLTALILGEILFNVGYWGLIVGTVLYHLVFTLVVELNLDPIFNNLLKALFIILLLVIKRLSERGSHAQD